jgi:hypothetical protein
VEGDQVRYLIIEVPPGFPDPLLDSEKFDAAREAVGHEVVMWSRSVRGEVTLRITYRCTPDPVALVLASDFAEAAAAAH